MYEESIRKANEAIHRRNASADRAVADIGLAVYPDRSAFDDSSSCSMTDVPLSLSPGCRTHILQPNSTKQPARVLVT